MLTQHRCETMKRDEKTLAMILPLWRGVFGNTPASVAEALRCGDPDLRELMQGIGANNNARGRWFFQQLGAYVGGLRFMLASCFPSRWVVELEPQAVLRKCAA